MTVQPRGALFSALVVLWYRDLFSTELGRGRNVEFASAGSYRLCSSGVASERANRYRGGTFL